MSLAPPQQTTAPTTSAPPMTPINSTPQTVTTGTEPPAAPPAPAPTPTQQPQPAAQVKPESAAAQAPSAIKFEEISAQLSDSKIPVEQRQQFAQQFVQDHVNKNPDVMKGFRDIQAGNANTPEAQKYQAQLQSAQDAFIKQHVERAVQNSPEAANNPQSFGAFASQAANNAMQQFQAMPMPMQLMMGIGLPVGLVGMMSSLFGEGGMGAGLLGVLGLGAAGAAGAAGGMFGQDAQNMTTDALYNVGTFFGAMPEKADFSALKGPDALQKLTAGPTISDAAATWWDPKAKAQEVQGQLDQADQLSKLMMAPEGMRAGLIQKMDSSLSPEEAQQIAANAAQAHTAMQDPESALAKKLQQARDFVTNPEGYVNQQTLNAVNPMNWFKSGSTNMDIQYLISRWVEKSAFNDVDAKELSDLKAEKAKGAPYRVETARRENKLQMRQNAEAPQKEIMMAACQKAARCWAGYEPVPGAKAYSKGSCRPKGSKKTQKEMKKT